MVKALSRIRDRAFLCLGLGAKPVRFLVVLKIDLTGLKDLRHCWSCDQQFLDGINACW